MPAMATRGWPPATMPCVPETTGRVVAQSAAWCSSSWTRGAGRLVDRQQRETPPGLTGSAPDVILGGQRRPSVNFGTFLLMQSPSARSAKEIFSRGVEMGQAAEALGFRNVWLAEHH